MPENPKLILLENQRALQTFNLNAEQSILGRDRTADVVLDFPGVSRRHARIFSRGLQFFLEDLQSSNGTFINDQRLSEPVLLSSGDRIRLGGNVHLQVELPVPEAQTVLMDTGATLEERIPPTFGETVLGDNLAEIAAFSPPQVEVAIAGGARQTYSLTQARYSIGRNDDNEIIINSPLVSRHHALLEKAGTGYRLTILPEAKNPVYRENSPVQGTIDLRDGELLRIGSTDPGLMVTIAYRFPAQRTQEELTRQIKFDQKDSLQIGRDSGNDVVLSAPNISRYHALFERVGQRFRLQDLGSSNGTFVNDERIEKETWLNIGDTIRIGPYRFVLGEDQLTEFDESRGLRVDVVGLNKWVRKDLNLLKDLSMVFKPREFVVVVGQSGGGKSTLVDAIAGYRPATDGQVLVNDVNVYKYFDAIRDQIGFVPQKDIIHMELTVYQELDYAAQMRMPSDTTAEERHQRVIQVLQELDLVHRKDVQISGLSGGQQKRVSIGVELITKPGLFFLDEPSSGLDPGTETALMHLMRRLADQGRTIILITHATKNVMLADKVVFLARGGYLAWFGPPDEALNFFDQYRDERDRRSRPMEFDQIYAILDDPAKGKAEEWAARYHENPAYQKHIVQALVEKGYASPITAAAIAPKAVTVGSAPTLPKPKKFSSTRQFRILSSRNMKILTRDRASLVLMLAAAPLVGLLDVVLALALGRNLFDYRDGVMASVITSLFMPLLYAILVGALSQMREFVKEKDIYKRERLVNLRVLPYVMSKVSVAILLAIYQAVCYTTIHYLAFNMPGGATELILFFVTMLSVVFSGMMLGLLGSAIAPNANAAPLIVILLVVPQLVLAGALIPLPGAVTSFTTTRWAFESLVSITGPGSDVAADACWALPEEIRNEMTLEDKLNTGCNCMGSNALRQELCDFPGMAEFYDPAIDQAEPLEPQSIGDPPAEPFVPPSPVPPADQSDQVAMAQFFLDIQDYQKQVAVIQDDYKRQISDYQAQAEIFKEEMTNYQTDRAEWEIARNAAVGQAEGLIQIFHKDFSWAFVDKNDSSLYNKKLSFALAMQLIFQGICFALILVVMSRKK